MLRDDDDPVDADVYVASAIMPYDIPGDGSWGSGPLIFCELGDCAGTLYVSKGRT